jgi:pimeloyl-ACP methyl ester carboxylesterase
VVTAYVRGYEARMVRAGTGDPVVFLRDTLGPGGWAPFMTMLAGRYDMIVPEHPGFGGTQLPAWLETVSDLANFYLDFLDALGLDRVHLVGCGVGGWIAADLAMRDTRRLVSLTLVAPAGLRVAGVRQVDVFLGGEDEVLASLIHDPDYATRLVAETLVPETEDMRLRNQQAAAQVTWRPRLYDPHLGKWLHRINVPTLLVWGENDRLFPLDYATAWRMRMPAARLETLAECGHMPPFEKPDEFCAILTRFLAGRRAAA